MPAVIGREAGWIGCQSVTGLTLRDSHFTGNAMHVFGLWENARVPRENTHRQEEDINSRAEDAKIGIERG